MRTKTIWIAILAISLLSCKSQYRITQMSGTIVEMNSTFDAAVNQPMRTLVQSYKTQLDKEMNEVIGTSAIYMDYARPESLLTNLTSDVMKAYGDEHLPGGADVAIMNVHGHRATMPKGQITVGNLYEIYSFDNTITFLELKGSDLIKIFQSYAAKGGAGVSENVRLIIDNKKIGQLSLNGGNINPDKIYKIVTLDYLADGNDGMSAFKNALKKTDTGITLRDVMIDYVKEQTRQGSEISSKLDQRISILK